MTKKMVLIAIILLVSFTMGQVVTRGKVVIADEETVIVKDIDGADIELDVERLVDKALEGLDEDDIDIPRERLRGIIQKNVHEMRTDEGQGHRNTEIRMEKRIGSEGHCRGARGGMCGPPGFNHPGEFGFTDNGCNFGMFGLFALGFLWMFVVLIMWIISLCVFSRGMKKIAAKLDKKTE